MGSGFSKMKKQARLMQEEMSKVKERLQNVQVEASVGGGLVSLTLNGEKDLKKITIQPEALNDLEGLQDLIITAFEIAAAKLEKERPDENHVM